MSDAVRDLDRALNGSTTTLDEEITELVAMGEEIRAAYMSFTPGHGPQRALFVGAVADRATPPRRTRFLAPVTVTAVLLISLVFLGRSAPPGGAFYPVRKVLRTVGLAPASVQEVRGRLVAADRLLDKAEALDPRQIKGAQRLAFQAVRLIGMAEADFADLDVDDKARVDTELSLLLRRAEAILTDEPEEDGERRDGQARGPREQGPERSETGSDNSASRRGPSSRSNSGPGSERSGGGDSDDRREEARERAEEARNDDPETTGETGDDDDKSASGGGNGGGNDNGDGDEDEDEEDEEENVEEEENDKLDDPEATDALRRSPALPALERKPPRD